MATAAATDHVSQIGQIAGTVWKTLSEQGPLSLAQLVKRSSHSRDTVMQALGWLAREDKIIIEIEGRSRVVSLRES